MRSSSSGKSRSKDRRGPLLVGVGVVLLGIALLWAAESEETPDLVRRLARGKKATALQILPENAMTFHRLRAAGAPQQANFRGPAGSAPSVRTVWSVNGEDVATGLDLDPEYFRRGDLVEARTEVDTPENGLQVVDRAQVVIANAPPSVRSATVQRPKDRPNQAVATIDAADPDGDVVELELQWKVDGVVDARATGNTYDVSGLSRGQTIALVAVATDGDARSTPRETGALDVSNQPPTLTVDATPRVNRDGEGKVEATLGAHFVDADGDPLKVELESEDPAFRWDSGRDVIVWSVEDGSAVHDVVLRVRDDRGGSAERVITLKR